MAKSGAGRVKTAPGAIYGRNPFLKNPDNLLKDQLRGGGNYSLNYCSVVSLAADHIRTVHTFRGTTGMIRDQKVNAYKSRKKQVNAKHGQDTL